MTQHHDAPFIPRWLHHVTSRFLSRLQLEAGQVGGADSSLQVGNRGSGEAGQASGVVIAPQSRDLAGTLRPAALLTRAVTRV